MTQADNKIARLYQILFNHYGEQHWWPCKSGDRWEIMMGAILTQNTSWKNVEKSLINLSSANIFSPVDIIQADSKLLCDAIHPAGYYNQKSRYLRNLAVFYLEHKEDLFHKKLQSARADLLSIKGIGKETADSILLYAFNRPIFIIDAYTRRVAMRHLRIDASIDYDILQSIFMNALPSEAILYNEYHALLVQFCKDSCLKKGCGSFCEHVYNLLR